jgi:DNA-binding PadR family transcriptional regulator
VNSEFPRLSATERLILSLLTDGERYGLELVEQSSGTLKRGTVYVTLQRMQARG